MPIPKSSFLSITAVCLGLAIVAGVLQWRESAVVIAVPEVRFSFLNDMTWDAATGRIERTGSDPHGWIELPGAALPIRRVAVEFGGTVDPAEGHFYFFQSVTTPVHIGLGMVDGKVTGQPGGVRVEAELDDSRCLRIDLPDFLLRPLALRRVVIERPFFNPGSWKLLTMVGAGLGAIAALGALAANTYLHRRGLREAICMIFALSAVLRIGVTAVNREAGDDHIRVCRMIMNEWRLPTAAEDWEGFQPKLYHATVAVVGRLLPLGRSPVGLLLTAQALSCLAGLACLGLTYRFLRELPISDWTRLWCFAFTAFNPKLIALHAQAANDSFVILFGALAIYAAMRYLRTGTWRDWGWLTAALCLAALSKASGLVLAAALPGVVVIDLIRRIWRRKVADPRVAVKQLAWRMAALGLAFAILVPVPGQYFQRFKESGTPFATNLAVQPRPHWSERTYVMRPGIISVRDGFLTFPLRSLLESPMITNLGAWESDQIVFPGDGKPNPTPPKAYPFHMVSFWAQLYGGFYFAHFDRWPPGWQSPSLLLIALGKILMLAGLLPCALWLLGLWPKRTAGNAPATSNHPTARAEHLLSLVCVAASLAFVAFYAVRIRDYSAMKAIFLFPAWLGFIAVFANGLERAPQFMRTPLLRGVLNAGLGLVVLLGLLDIMYLFFQLFTATRSS